MRLRIRIATGLSAILLGVTSAINVGAISTELHAAVKEGNTEGVKTLCKEHPDWINEQEDGAGMSSLRYAVYQNNLDIVKYLVEHGAKVEGDLLVNAVINENLDMVKCLVENSWDINYKSDGSDTTALSCAFTSLIQLRYSGKDVKTLDDMEYWEAKCKLYASIVDYLFSQGAKSDVNYLRYAISACDIDAVKYLIGQGIDVNAKDSGGGTQLGLLLDDMKKLKADLDVKQEYYEKLQTIADYLRSKGAKE